MVVELLHIFTVVCTAFICGKLISGVRLPAILGWLIAGIVFGPYLAGIVTLDVINSWWYQVFIKFFECFAGVMIGREMIFKKIASSGKQIVGITFVQSIGTFLFVSAVFTGVFYITGLPVYLSVIFGGIALATAPVPALSIVNEYRTRGPATKTLIPLAVIDDIIGVIVFFTMISICKRNKWEFFFFTFCDCGNDSASVCDRNICRSLRCIFDETGEKCDCQTGTASGFSLYLNILWSLQVLRFQL